MTPEKFYVKGHHLRHLALAWHLGIDGALARTSLSIHSCGDNGEERYKRYVADVLGPDKIHEPQFVGGVGAFFAEFKALPLVAPLVIGLERDLICQSCYKGEHCAGTRKGDLSWISKFCELAASLPPRGGAIVTLEKTGWLWLKPSLVETDKKTALMVFAAMRKQRVGFFR